MADLSGKVALVTGVGRAGQVGAAMAAGLGEAGARLVVVDRAAARATAQAQALETQGIQAHPSAGDLTMPETAEAAVAEARRVFGGLDIVVNVAGGMFRYGAFLEQPPATLDPILAANVKTTVYTCQAALPALLERGGGAIVNFASIAVLRPASHMAYYAAAKSAVAGFTRALAQEFSSRGVRINAVAPATLRTGENSAQLGSDAPMVELHDLVRVVVFLVSDAARAVSGQVIAVTPRER